MGLTDSFHTFLSSQPPFPAYRKHAVLWALTQEPGDSAAIKLQRQEATEQTELHDLLSALSSRQYFRIILEGLSCQHLHLEISDSSISSHLQNRPWGGGSAYFTDGETASETRKWLIQLPVDGRGQQASSFSWGCHKLSLLWPRAKVCYRKIKAHFMRLA